MDVLCWNTWNHIKRSMARIYINCPGGSSQGSSVYTLSRIAIVIAILLLTILGITFLLPGSSSAAEYDTPNKEDKQYAIVIDCGSSGSRVYIYWWPPHSGIPSDLLSIKQLQDNEGNLIQKKVSPGLSTFGENPDAASDHIKDLLLFASEYIPEKKYSETFLYTMATAGMRMLPKGQQKAILLDLQTDIRKDFKFIALDNHFEVISGKQEGMYAWIAINYALNRFQHSDSHSGSKTKTVGMMDMGGGSVQIGFEVPEAASKEIPSPLLAEFNLGCQDTDELHTYRLYVTTFLGFGANSALDRYRQKLVKHWQSSPIADTCLPSGMKQTFEVDGSNHDFLGSGDLDQCKSQVESLVNKSVPCTKSPCSVNGVYQPTINPSMEFYGFSEFWYSMEDVYGIGGKYSQDEFHEKAKEFCSTSWAELEQQYKEKKFPKADDHRFRFQCFKSAWLEQMLHLGFDFPTSYSHLTSAQLVNGKDVGWTLGALLYKTRFLPLRDVERRQELHVSGSLSTWQRVARLPDLHFLLVLCVLVVLAAIVAYMRWLKCCPRSQDLQRVPSMSYFMTDNQSQMEQGKGSMSSHTKGQGFVL